MSERAIPEVHVLSRPRTELLSGARLGFLDALRGLAAAYVVVYHLLLIPQPNLPAPLWAEKFAHAGGNGVIMFFLVSAFSLCYTMPLRERDSSPVASFYLHRFFRIAPLFYLLIVLTLVRDRILFDTGHSVGEVLASVFFVFNLLPTGQEGFVWASWTIGIEMVFYACFPLIYLWTRDLGKAVAFFFGSILLWMAVQLLMDYLLMPADWKASILQWHALKHFPTFALGIVLFFAFKHCLLGGVVTPAARSAGSAILLGGLFGFCAMLQGWLPAVFGSAYGWSGVMCALIALGLALWPVKALVNPMTAYLGKVSYSLYLLHPTIIYLLIPVYRTIYADAGSVTLAFLASLALTFAILLPLSSLSYRFVEKPGIGWGRRIASRWLAKAPDAPAMTLPQESPKP